MKRFTCILILLATACDNRNMPRIHKRFAVGHFMKVKHNLAVQLAEAKASALSEIKGVFNLINWFVPLNEILSGGKLST